MIHCDFLLTNIMIICWRLGLPNQTLRKWSEKNTVNHVDPRETIINFQFWGQGWFIVGRIDASGLAVVSSSFLRRSAMLKWKWLQCHEHVGRILRQKSRWRFPKMLPPLMKNKTDEFFVSSDHHLQLTGYSEGFVKQVSHKTWISNGSGSKYTTDPFDVPSISQRNHWHPLWCHSRSSKRSVPTRPGDNGIDNSHPHRWPTCCKRQIGRSSFPQTCATKRDEESGWKEISLKCRCLRSCQSAQRKDTTRITCTPFSISTGNLLRPLCFKKQRSETSRTSGGIPNKTGSAPFWTWSLTGTIRNPHQNAWEPYSP